MASWYKNSISGFLADDINLIISLLHQAASHDGWHIEPDQDVEWRSSIEILQKSLCDESLHFLTGVLVEYDFRRRGLRIDFILVAPVALFVIEFKRGAITTADRDQVMNYCVNLVEFHELTQKAQPKVFPLLITRQSKSPVPHNAPIEWHQDWPQLCRRVFCITPAELAVTLHSAWNTVSGAVSEIEWEEWDTSSFQPSSTIIDATISLYGQHDVSAIKAHAASKMDIDACVSSVIEEIDRASALQRKELILVSGAPGAGKTLVGLSITFHEGYRGDAVFVTGNAPLVEVLNGSLQRSYIEARKQGRTRPLGGYTRAGMGFIERNADFKIVKAHNFLETVHTSGQATEQVSKLSSDGRILIFDEAQRTYAEGTLVNRRKLEHDEALLILHEMNRRPEAIIVLLLGHNQNINRGELGSIAWIHAARECGWHFAVSDETLALEEFSQENIASDPLRLPLTKTHLMQSIRDQRTRNGEIERWAHYVMTNQPQEAMAVALSLPNSSAINLSRSLMECKQWVRERQTGEDRCGLIASGQGRHLRPDGIFVDEKPDIVHWMLAPSDDVRSSNMLEQTQNQYQIQGLELDYSIVCWDGDFRRVNKDWACFNVVGSGWNRGSGEDEARCNSYRVLLTRSRKGMVIFVPVGDLSGNDMTRHSIIYDEIANYLIECGANLLT